MNSTVVGQAKLTVLATVDVRPTSLAMQFITLSVHLCVQHDAREAPRRSGSSATADPCSRMASYRDSCLCGN